MKTVSILLVLLSTLSAQAIQVQKCKLNYNGKSDHEPTWSQYELLVEGLSNRITFGKTVLDLTVSKGKLAGYVNGQPGFILNGTPEAGAFESAYSKGTIECEKSQNLNYLIQDRGYAKYFTIDQSMSNGLSVSSVDITRLRRGDICFVGNAQSFAVAMQNRDHFDYKVLDQYSVEFTYDYKYCSKPTGSSQDDSGCDEYTTLKETKRVHDCSENHNYNPQG